MTGRNLYTILYIAAAAICVGISVYLSYFGYYSHLQELTLFFAVLLGILLFATDLMFRHYRLEGRGPWVPLAFFLVVVVFSWASNYNFLYTSFMERDVAERTVVEQFRLFRDDLTQTRRALAEHPVVAEVQEERRTLERELHNIQQQLTDPVRPGCGQRCRSHVAEIEALLGERVSDLAVPAVGASAEENEAWFERYREIVREAFVVGIDPTYHEVRALAEQIEALLAEHADPLAALRREYEERRRAVVETRDFAIIAELRNQSTEIERQANVLLPESLRVEHARIHSDLDQLGEIPLSIRDGFIERANPGVTAVTTLLALFVDFVPVLFAWLIFRPEPRRTPGRPGSRLSWRGRGRVATP
ncbi:hypothetical protein CKO15_01175 [Halorhodospira abdelmalekii]|uniref:hypothetical protein n=1 Tax=Halorhodospira abdelmalekii TaxID=421629 RepID=UPI0019041979|nr:hypothetical protein [Halorhodospira abdelmalekii]MBK1733912.1 hypothetical protein [Halorhodospira abdelmalekii]